MSKLWFMPATPILSNGGTSRGLPVSCFLNETEDSLVGILNLWNENVWLASRGGGIGSYWGNLRSIGERVRGSGKTSGIIPFIVVQNALTLAISQGSLRRGSSAVYLPVWHPEIEEFLDIRRPTGGDPNRKALNIHHGVLLSDEFMMAVDEDKTWDLISPKDGAVISTIKARDLWIKILTTRVETGEPYLIFVDTVNRHKPEIYKTLGLDIKMSNLCTEITLATGEDHLKQSRTAICCLASLNLEFYDMWCSNTLFVEDVMRFLDNVLTDFINKAPPEINRAKYSAMRERSIGVGVMGFHSFLQSKMVPFESFAATMWNKKIFSHIKSQADAASYKLALEKGACPDAIDANKMERFVHKLSIAPTASISIIAGNTSPGIEPYAANVFTHKTLTGSFTVRNKFLQELLKSKGKDNVQVWSSISTNEGSVQHLDFLGDHEKLVFRTAYELDQRWVIEHSADRTPYICQSQSVNIFMPAGVHKRYLHKVHFLAWKKGVKSLYYTRSKSVQQADKVSHDVNVASVVTPSRQITNFDYDECLACQ
ncbi:vitamin B12-dependent ribonucleoside-diphosphate reductase [Anaplasma platys]|uniref:Vitamin B12-dependent ribonucleoside-diphosphate reductase n=2 Tax=Anaplasma platys TaxID=949 RepID=A0A858PXU1_9RICK|nr:vitamin B12-dependent ribonucleoside-diphosphate reductase [Anaplasma platys]